jgi:hypothetical protein
MVNDRVVENGFFDNLAMNHELLAWRSSSYERQAMSF